MFFPQPNERQWDARKEYRQKHMLTGKEQFVDAINAEHDGMPKVISSSRGGDKQSKDAHELRAANLQQHNTIVGATSSSSSNKKIVSQQSSNLMKQPNERQWGEEARRNYREKQTSRHHPIFF